MNKELTITRQFSNLIIKLTPAIEEYKFQRDKGGVKLDSMEELIKFIVDEL